MIGPRCYKLKHELNTYVWDNVSADKGEDEVVKRDDHLVDCLRYFAYTTFSDSLDIKLTTKAAGF